MLAKYLHFISFFPQQGRLIFFIHPESYFIILLLIECNLVRRKYCPKALVRQNLAITKSQGTSKICAISRGFVISRLFFIYFTVTGLNKMVRYTRDFVLQRFVKSSNIEGSYDTLAGKNSLYKDIFCLRFLPSLLYVNQLKTNIMVYISSYPLMRKILILFNRPAPFLFLPRKATRNK